VVYAGSDGGVLYARQATTGLLLWSFSGALGDHIVSAPAVVNGVVYVSGNSHMYALAAATGQELWSFGTPFREESAPTVVNGAVYFSSANGNVDALAAASGHKLWSFTATGQHTSVAGSPAVADGVVYFGTVSDETRSDDAVYALTAATGAEQWRFTTAAAISGTPAVANGLVYIGADINFTQTGATFYALLATTGKKVWTFARCCGFTSSAAVANGVVYLGENSSLLALDAATGRELLILAFSSSVADVEPAVANGMLAFETGFKGQLYAFGLTS